MKVEKGKSIVINLILNFIRTGLSLIFPVITFSYASRVLSVNGIGKVNYAKSIVVYFSMIAQLGIRQYGAREAAKIRDDKKRLSNFTQEMLIINTISTMLALSLFNIIIWNFPKLEDYRLLLLLNGMTIVLSGLGMEWLYDALEEYHYITVRSLVFQFASLILLFIFVKKEKDIYAYTVINVIANTGSYVLNFFHSWKYISWKKEMSYHLKRHIKPIFILFAFAISVNLYTVLDVTILGIICGDKAVGVYSAAEKVNKLVNSLIISLGAVLMPRLSYYIEKNLKQKFETIVYSAYKIIFLLSIPSFIGLWMLSEEIILVFSGEAFFSGIVTMRLLTPIVLFIPFSGLTNNQILIPMRKDKLILFSTCIGALVNLLCNLLLIPQFAENGAAAATVFSEMAVAMVCLYNAHRFFPLQSIFSGVWKYWISAASIILIKRIVSELHLHYFWSIAITALVGASTYLGMLYLFKEPLLGEIIKRIKVKIKAR